MPEHARVSAGAVDDEGIGRVDGDPRLHQEHVGALQEAQSVGAVDGGRAPGGRASRGDVLESDGRLHIQGNTHGHRCWRRASAPRARRRRRSHNWTTVVLSSGSLAVKTTVPSELAVPPPTSDRLMLELPLTAAPTTPTVLDAASTRLWLLAGFGSHAHRVRGMHRPCVSKRTEPGGPLSRTDATVRALQAPRQMRSARQARHAARAPCAAMPAALQRLQTNSRLSSSPPCVWPNPAAAGRS